jgi:hypothetical protein
LRGGFNGEPWAGCEAVLLAQLRFYSTYEDSFSNYEFSQDVIESFKRVARMLGGDAVASSNIYGQLRSKWFSATINIYHHRRADCEPLRIFWQPTELYQEKPKCLYEIIGSVSLPGDLDYWEVQYGGLEILANQGRELGADGLILSDLSTEGKAIRFIDRECMR